MAVVPDGIRLTTTTTDAGQTSRIEYLDSIRGIAAFAVFLGHFAMGFGPVVGGLNLIQSSPISLLWNGAAGVSVFFVLSGFVLSYQRLGRAPIRRRPIRQFYVSRACRLYIPYWAVLIVSLMCWRFVFVHLETRPPGNVFFFYANWLNAAETLSRSRLLLEHS